MTDTIGHRLDKHRSISHGNLACALCRLVHGQQVVTVDAYCVHAIADGSTGDAVARVLLACWCRNSVAVVTTEEYNWAVERASEVQRRMRVSYSQFTRLKSGIYC